MCVWYMCGDMCVWYVCMCVVCVYVCMCGVCVCVCMCDVCVWCVYVWCVCMCVYGVYVWCVCMCVYVCGVCVWGCFVTRTFIHTSSQNTPSNFFLSFGRALDRGVSPYLLAAATRAPFFTRTCRVQIKAWGGMVGSWRANLAYPNVVPKGSVVKRCVPVLVRHIGVNSQLEQLKGETGRGINRHLPNHHVLKHP